MTSYYANIPTNAVPTSVYVEPETIGIRPTIIPERFISIPKLSGQYYFPSRKIEDFSNGSVEVLEDVPTRTPQLPNLSKPLAKKSIKVLEDVPSRVPELPSLPKPLVLNTTLPKHSLPLDVPTRTPSLPRSLSKKSTKLNSNKSLFEQQKELELTATENNLPSKPSKIIRRTIK